MPHPFYVVAQGQRVFNGEHYRLSPRALVVDYLAGRAGNGDWYFRRFNQCLGAVENEVGIIERRRRGNRRDIAPNLIVYWLRHIRCHRRDIKQAVGHFFEVDLYFPVAPREIGPLREEHRRVAMRIERDNRPVQGLRALVNRRLADEPLEDFSALFAEPFGVPLDAHKRLVLRAFYGFDDAVFRAGDDAEIVRRAIDNLMMERIDTQQVTVVNVA